MCKETITIIDFLLKYQNSIQSFIMFISIIVTTATAFILHYLSKNERKDMYELSKIEKQKETLNSQLFELQRMALKYPFLEDEKFIETWDTLKDKYINNFLIDKDRDKVLQYEVYAEMIFNFFEMSLNVYKTEKELLEYVNFKSWLRNHSAWWKNPLEEHSNRDSYSLMTKSLIDDWLK